MKFRPVAKPAIDYSDTKEMIRAISVIDCEEKREVIVARWYMGRSRNASRVYCSIWFRHTGENRSGTAWAGGYGYDKRRASGYHALRAAGVPVSRFCGRDIADTLLELAKHYGADAPMIIRHG